MSDIERPARVRVVSNAITWPGSPQRRRSDRLSTPKIDDAPLRRDTVQQAGAANRTLVTLALFGLGCGAGGVLATLYDLPGMLLR